MTRLVLLSAVLLLPFFASPPAQAARRAPVILIVFDEFPADSLRRPDGRIDAARYPGFARLARTATWFPNAFTVQDQTSHALPAILDGRQPRRGSRPVYSDHPDNLFTLLAGRGYRVTASEPVSVSARLGPVPRRSWEAPGPRPSFCPSAPHASGPCSKRSGRRAGRSSSSTTRSSPINRGSSCPPAAGTGAIPTHGKRACQAPSGSTTPS